MKWNKKFKKIDVVKNLALYLLQQFK